MKSAHSKKFHWGHNPMTDRKLAWRYRRLHLFPEACLQPMRLSRDEIYA